ncbi:MAG: type I restriction enzyme HsdR N-terminal domain-containing protein, partial [Desulfobacteraceae bacterium]|nr:type I restriction enzyme HsdR N-terminal domain-containing protein [Desulfobacteraceae bacterium]
MKYLVDDYITGKPVRNMGSEVARQTFEHFLVEKKGYDKQDIKVDEKIIVQFKGEDYTSCIDLVVFCKDKAIMAITCVAGSIFSFEREILAGARLLYDYQIPFAVSTDAINAAILDTLTGEKYGEGLKDIPSKNEAANLLNNISFEAFDAKKKGAG